MKFRRLAFSALAAALLATSIKSSREYNGLSVNENYSESAPNSRYVRGKGIELESCIKDTLPMEISRIRKLLGINDTTSPVAVYTVFPDTVTLGKYYLDTIAIDTSKVYSDRRNMCGELGGHEAGHWGVDEKSLEIGLGHWPPLYNQDTASLAFWWDKTVSEGFATLLSGREYTSKVNWPVNLQEISHADHYRLGSFLLSGLVKEFGYKALVPVVIENPASDSETFHPHLWQERIKGIMENEGRIKKGISKLLKTP